MKSLFMRDHLYIIGIHHRNILVVKLQLVIIIKLLYHDNLTSTWQDREDMRTMFRVCATERLFVPDMFPDMDRAIYIDTDLIFMRFLDKLLISAVHGLMVTSSPPPILLAPDPKPIHFRKAYDNSYSKMNKEHKYKDKDEYKDKTKTFGKLRSANKKDVWNE